MKRIKQHHKVYKQRFRIRPTKVETPLPKKKLKYKDYYLQDDFGGIQILDQNLLTRSDVCGIIVIKKIGIGKGDTL